MSDSSTTTDHDAIRDWVEARGGHPARVADTATDGGGLLRIDFEPPADGLERISWSDWFKVFEESKLAFLYQDRAADGAASRFNKLVSRD